MKSRDFCFWLQGFFEITEAKEGPVVGLSPSQVHALKQHLALVFKHEIDPSQGDTAHQAELNKIHNNKGNGDTKMRC